MEDEAEDDEDESEDDDDAILQTRVEWDYCTMLFNQLVDISTLSVRQAGRAPFLFCSISKLTTATAVVAVVLPPTLPVCTYMFAGLEWLAVTSQHDVAKILMSDLET